MIRSSSSTVRGISSITLLVLSFATFGAAVAAPPAGGQRPRPILEGAQLTDYAGHVNANQIDMFVSNVGAFATDRATSEAGFEYPLGSMNFAIYAAGEWLGARVGGGRRLAITEYADEYRAGAMVGGVADLPSRTQYRVHRLSRSYGTIAERTSAMNTWNTQAVPYGAPSVTILGDGTLSIGADLMLWEVHNEAAASGHLSDNGSTAPLGIEVQNTYFAFNSADARGRTIFVRSKLLNKGGNNLTSMYFGLWSDPDLGDPSDDLIGCDTTRSLLYCYNGTNNDNFYGPGPPAIGIDLLRGPIDRATGRVLKLTSFYGYGSGGDPVDSVESENILRGLQLDGSTIVNPVNGQPTRFYFSGDPVAGTGWRDIVPADRRMLGASGPFTMTPGDSQSVWFALLIGDTDSNLGSVTDLKAASDFIQSFFNAGLPVVGVEPNAASDLALRVWPNPGSETSFAFTLPATGRVRAVVYDVAGREVSEIANGELPAGVHERRWDGRDGHGGRAGAGIYFVRVETPGGTQVRRFVRMD